MTEEELILAFNMFEGDRDSNVRLLSDKMVDTRAPHRCVICQETFPAKSRARARTERDNTDKRVMTFYACPVCCRAMAASWEDAGAAIRARHITVSSTLPMAASWEDAGAAISERTSIGMAKAHG